MFASRRSLFAKASSSRLPSSADAVVVGGGIIGLSTAYHLQQLGLQTVLLEQSRLTAGTTWHAAGLITRFGAWSELAVRWRDYARFMYQTGLEAQHGHETGYRGVGFIELASDGGTGNREDGLARLEEFRRVAAFNRLCGVDVQELSPQEVQDLWPLANIEGVECGFYVEGDGRVNPVDAANAFAAGARQQGALIVEGARVVELETNAPRTRATGVKVQMVSEESGASPDSIELHTIKTGAVVNCAGMWGRQLAELLPGGAALAPPAPVSLQAAEHYYLLTGTIPDMDHSLPVLEDPACYGYYRPEGDGMLVGLFEPEAAAWRAREGVPADFSFGELPADWDRMTPFLERALSRVPAAESAGMRKFFCGPESFTSDLAPLVGELPGLRGCWMAAGLNSIGIISAPGLGRTLAKWIKNGAPDSSEDIAPLDVTRVLPHQSTRRYREQRVTEALGRVYKCHFPYDGMESARGAKRSPFYQHLLSAGAFFRDVSGFEGADYFDPDSEVAHPIQHSWGRPPFFNLWAAEHRACRESVILMDMSFMAKFLVQGEGAGGALNRMSTAHVDGPNGEINYTQWLKEDGRLLADLTVTKLAEDSFLVVATDTQTEQVRELLRRGLIDAGVSERVHVTDVTGAWSQLNVQGPKSRELLQAVVDADLSDAAHPFRAARFLEVGFAPRVLVTRITYVGELGYELFIPVEYAEHVFELLREEGEKQPFEVRLAGLKALNSLRLEKGYRDYGHDIDGTDTLLEAGLGFTANFDHEFIGREAVRRQKESKMLSKRLVSVLVTDPDCMAYHGEILYRNDVPHGYLRIAGYGHTLGGSVGLALVEHPKGDGHHVSPKYLREGEWSLDVAGKRYPARVSLRPLYDPKNEKIKL